VFSTQLVDIADMIENPQFSFENYAGHFRYINSFGDGALLKDINRLGTNGYLKIDGDKVIHKTYQWNISHEGEKLTVERLKSMINIKMPNREKPLFLLSGGMDSRTLLALFDNAPKLLTWGNKEDVDVQIAKMIGEKLKNNVDFYEHKLPSNFDEKLLVFDKMKKSVLWEFPWVFNCFSLFEEKNREGFWAIDGAYGEFLRFGFGRKLLYFAKKSWKQNDFIYLAKFVERKQYPCFNKQLQDDINNRAEQEFVSAMDNMQKNLSFEDWISLFIIRHGVKNNLINGQGVHDNLIPSYMPMIQPSILRSIQSVPAHERMNARLNKKIITEFQPILKSVPLAWYESKVPFFLSRNIFLAKLYSVFYNKLGKQKQIYSDKLMFSLKELVLERIKSSAVRECGWYDTAKIIELAEMFYSGKHGDSQFLFDWLAVDYWREKLSEKK
jgi:hypothetical protein